MISQQGFPSILLIQGWTMLSLCQLPPSLLSFLTWMTTIASFLWETFLLHPDEVLKPFSKQCSIETVLYLSSLSFTRWYVDNIDCPSIWPWLQRLRVDGSMAQQAKRETTGRDGVTSECCYCLYFA